MEAYEFPTHDEKQKKSPEAGTQSNRLSEPFQCRKTLDPYAAEDGQGDVWTDEMRTHYEAENEPWSFFETPQLQRFRERVTEFVPSTSAAASPVRTAKVGRNDPCPCGSGKKY